MAEAAGGARPGGTTGSRRNQENPAWSVADEDFTHDYEARTQMPKKKARISRKLVLCKALS